jgi:hypothetical protein
METGSAATGGVRAAKACDRGGNECCREKILHVCSLHFASLGRDAALDDEMCEFAKINVHPCNAQPA